MSMQELPDDQLDGLFRKSLEEPELPYDPTTWPGVRDKLNTHDRQQFWLRWLRRSLPILLLCVVPIGIWLVAHNGSTEPAMSQKTAPTGMVKTGNNKLGRTDTNLAERTQKAASASGAVQGVRSSAVVNEVPILSDNATVPQTTLAPVTKRPNPSQIPPNQSFPDRLVAAELNNPNRPAGKTLIAHEARLTARNPFLKASRTGKNSRHISRSADVPPIKSSGSGLVRYARTEKSAFTEQSMVPVSRVDRDLDLASSTNIVSLERFSLPVGKLPNPMPKGINLPMPIDRLVQAPEPDRSVAQPQSSGKVNATSLSVRMLVAPDLSTIGLTNFSRPGTNVGLMLEYQRQRWRVQVGVLRSVKVYQATESTYEYSTMGQWSVIPSSIGGRCNMLDIPINLRYDVALIPRRNEMPPSRWFVSGGTTTYYMLREDYTYNYDNPDDPKIKYRDWTTETGRYGFSQLNVSGGYERAITPRLYWQVEPFLKVPLKGVGFYKVNLLSTGVFFSLRYRL